MLLHILFILN